MADINPAIIPLRQNEGGYSNVDGDNGGETYIGISRNNWPNWEGWRIVDTNKPLRDEGIIHNPVLDKLVTDFYYSEFWEANNLEDINNQAIATKLLDMCVNMGSSRGIKILQQSLANDFRYAIDIDGIAGNETIKYTNQAGTTLLGHLRQRCKDFYEGLAEEHPNDKQFLNGWLRRAGQ